MDTPKLSLSLDSLQQLAVCQQGFREYGHVQWRQTCQNSYLSTAMVKTMAFDVLGGW